MTVDGSAGLIDPAVAADAALAGANVADRLDELGVARRDPEAACLRRSSAPSSLGASRARGSRLRLLRSGASSTLAAGRRDGRTATVTSWSSSTRVTVTDVAVPAVSSPTTNGTSAPSRSPRLTASRTFSPIGYRAGRARSAGRAARPRPSVPSSGAAENPSGRGSDARDVGVEDAGEGPASIPLAAAAQVLG